MQSATQLVSKLLREETKQANGNLFSDSILTQAKSGEEEKALMPATFKSFSLLDNDIKELTTEKLTRLVEKIITDYIEKNLEEARQKTLIKKDSKPMRSW